MNSGDAGPSWNCTAFWDNIQLSKWTGENRRELANSKCTERSTMFHYKHTPPDVIIFSYYKKCQVGNIWTAFCTLETEVKKNAESAFPCWGRKAIQRNSWAPQILLGSVRKAHTWNSYNQKKRQDALKVSQGRWISHVSSWSVSETMEVMCILKKKSIEIKDV